MTALKSIITNIWQQKSSFHVKNFLKITKKQKYYTFTKFHITFSPHEYTIYRFDTKLVNIYIIWRKRFYWTTPHIIISQVFHQTDLSPDSNPAGNHIGRQFELEYGGKRVWRCKPGRWVSFHRDIGRTKTLIFLELCHIMAAKTD